MLGLDPLYVANEGLFIAIVDHEIAADFITLLHTNSQGKNAAIIGEVVKENPGKLVMKSLAGGHRLVNYLTGDQLPRIC